MSFQTLEALAVRTRVARVDLLPRDFADTRRARRVRVLLGAGVLAVAGLCAGAAAVTGGHVTQAQDALATEQSRTAGLRAEQAPYAEVPQVQAALTTAQDVRDAVEQHDVAWYSYLDRVATSSPPEFAMTSLVFTLAEPTETSTAAVTNPLAVPGVGTMTASGQTKSQDTVAAWMDAMATIPGFAAPTLTNSALDPATGVISFTAGVTLTDGVLQSEQ
ncbi:Tfp pilus assembly protein PilN [Kineococcus radiotolerans]|uniref:Tfp pilus assembly protein PilN n=1 Tax=Kineococcus radiotolerans TaxID=131568 RepID=A0A7W4TPQ0_KINRA|nr:hypothetical protein [Kineococcus radiotolerans]MBB2902843.1 Tfp pilus assembly protein PilN [Kineococcus radiotolerans]